MKNEQIKHIMEQYGSFLDEFAGVVAQYFKALLRNGFMRDEALQLTLVWQKKVFDEGYRDKSEGAPPL